MHRYFVTGIDTNIGKTVVSAILVKALNASYWKPIQSGDLDYTDSMKVQAMSGADSSRIISEKYRLTKPASPHLSAELENVTISLDDFQLPEVSGNLIVEGAGGLMVPLNYQDTILGLIQKLALPVILVSKNYLGSINHTLLSIYALKRYNIPIKGIIISGEAHTPTEKAIESIGGVKILHHIPYTENLNQWFIKEQAEKLVDKLLHVNSFK